MQNEKKLFCFHVFTVESSVEKRSLNKLFTIHLILTNGLCAYQLFLNIIHVQITHVVPPFLCNKYYIKNTKYTLLHS